MSDITSWTAWEAGDSVGWPRSLYGWQQDSKASWWMPSGRISHGTGRQRQT